MDAYESMRSKRCHSGPHLQALSFGDAPRLRAHLGAVAGLARVEALCAAAIATADPRSRALHQSLARPVAEQVLRTFALPD